MDITAKTSDDNYDVHSQTSAVHTVTAYNSPSKSYLVVRAKQDIFEVGNNVDLEMLTTNIHVSVFNLLILSRGHVVYAKTLNRDAGLVTTENVEVTTDMIPSVRVVAYYIIDNTAEVVADSQWIDVVDKCSNEVEISTNKDSYEPESPGQITLKGEPNTLVGLSMVDSAVFLLNDRHILSRKKMFDTLETFDLGCGPGGGKDAADVFFESGLSVVTTTNFNNTVRDELECTNPAHNRKRRQAKTPKADLHKELCCKEGRVILNDTICYDRASELVNATSLCRQAFYECCKRRSGMGRSGDEEQDMIDMFDVFEADVVFRANFPESQLFESHTIGPSGVKGVPMTLPSSITKWVIQGISVSPTSGMCVSKKANVTVFKNFFMDVRIPVKAVRGEQLEVKVTAYNYGSKTKVHVYMYGVKGMCSEACAGEKTSRRELIVPENGASSTSYPIIPLNIKDYEIKVEAHSTYGGDGVRKILHVVAEGKHKTYEFNVTLDPQDKLKEPESGVQNDGHCTKRYTDKEKWALRKTDLLRTACDDADYVYRVKVVSIDVVKGLGLMQRKVTAHLKTIIKPGANDGENARKNAQVGFRIVHLCTEPKLEIGRDYLIMGKDGQISEGNRMKYDLDDRAFVMEYYNKYDRTLTKNERVLGHRMGLMEQALDKGCPENKDMQHWRDSE